LRAIRPAYLSTAPARRSLFSAVDSNGNGIRSPRPPQQAPLTNKQKDELDAQSKQLLRQINSAITGLKTAEGLRNEAADSIALHKRAKGGLGALGRWAADGAVTAKSTEEAAEEAGRREVAASRESVIYFLQRRLEEASRVQSEMMEVRLMREVERSKSVLYKSRMADAIPYATDDEDAADATRTRKGRMANTYDAAWAEAGDDRTASELSVEQQQLFAQENADLLRQYNSQLEQITAAEKSIREISELQTTLVTNLQLQAEHIDQLVQDSYLTQENLSKGNKELKRASERRSTAQTMFYVTCALCGFLVVWDLVF